MHLTVDQAASVIVGSSPTPPIWRLCLDTRSTTRCQWNSKVWELQRKSSASGSWVPHLGRWWKGYHLVLIRLIFEFESRSSYFEKENSIRIPWVCLGEGCIPLARERASELVDMFFLCMSPLSGEKANKKIQHKRGFGGGRVGVRYSTLLSFLMIMG